MTLTIVQMILACVALVIIGLAQEDIRDAVFFIVCLLVILEHAKDILKHQHRDPKDK